MIHLERQIRLEVPVDKLWPLISDTERINRATGLPAVQYRAEAAETGPAKVFAQTRLGPLTMQWQEFPFEWVQEDYFQARRCFSKGFLKEIRPGVKLLPENGATNVKITLDFEGCNVLGTWIARHVLAPAVFRKFEKIFCAIQCHLRDNAPDPFAKGSPRGDVDIERLKIVAERLRKHNVPCELVDLLAAHLENAPDLDVAAMRPFALADRWGKDRIEVLKMFLHATREGLVDLSWEVLCPHCRKPNAMSGKLAGVAAASHCQVCQIQYDAQFDRSVEARFTPHPSVRKAPRNEFCAGGPGNTPHVMARVMVPAGCKRKFSMRAMGAPLTIRSPKVKDTARVRVLDMAQKACCAVKFCGEKFDNCTLEARTGNVEFELENTSREDRWFTVERERWDEGVATAAQVTSLQEFRDMFASDVLAPGTEIAVRNLTFLFTDLAGSTATYHALGDAKAYSMVREHFDVLKEVIAKHEGAVVKTIGDAVMAVFYSPRQGAMAALEMQEAMSRWCEAKRMEKPLVLKIGLHEGPSIAVNTDNILDYFGTSVNLAARVESLSAGKDIVFSDAVMQAVEQDSALQAKFAQKEKLQSPVKGFPEPVIAWRIRPF